MTVYCYGPCVCLVIRTFSTMNNVARLWASVSEPWAPGGGQRYSAWLFLVSRACMVCYLAPQSGFSALLSSLPLLLFFSFSGCSGIVILKTA